MKPFLYKFFHVKTNDRTENGMVFIPEDVDLWPAHWKTIEYKEYDRSPKIKLNDIDSESDLFKILRERTSEVSKLCNQVVTVKHVASLLKLGYGLVSSDVSERRTVPSAGARFPLELYVAVWGTITGLEKGNYHYNIKEHALDVLASSPIQKNEVIRYTPYTWMENAHGVIIVSAVFNRTINKYGSRGYRYLLLEAGHVAQNMCIGATENGLSVRPMGGINETVFEKLLYLDDSQEQIVYALVI